MIQILNAKAKMALIRAKQHSARLAAAGSMLFVGVAAHAQSATPSIDITPATAGITAGQVAVLAVLAAMIVFAAAKWGVKAVLKVFGG